MRLVSLLLLFFAATMLSAVEAERVVSLSPNLTETIYAIGAGDQLVGRSTACNMPPEARKLPVTGAFGRAFPESLLAVRPTLVVTAARLDSGRRQAEQAGAEWLMLPTATLADYDKTVEILGEKLHCQEGAAREKARFDGRIAEFRKAAADIAPEERPKVLLAFSVQPVTTAGKRSFLTELVDLAGGRSVTAEIDADYFVFSPEQIVAAAPDVIVLPGMAADSARFRELPGWNELPAVRAGRVYFDFDPDLICRLGPRTPEGIALLSGFFREARR